MAEFDISHKAPNSIGGCPWKLWADVKSRLSCGNRNQTNPLIDFDQMWTR